MAKKFSLSDFLHYTNRRTYSNTDGNVAYLDGAPLKRPLSMPRGQKIMLAIVVAVAVVIGALFVNNTVLSSLRESAAAEQAIVDNLARQASIETLPDLTKLVVKNDAGIKESLEDAGYSYYDASSTSDAGDLILYKIPSDMTVEEAAGFYARGISNITAPQATKLLNGSWQLVYEHSGTPSIVVRYTDFTTADPQVAVQNAMQKTGFDPESISDSGKDESGNTYNLGTITVDDTSYVWKISAVPFEDMYSIPNMPEDACYIGVRLTKA